MFRNFFGEKQNTENAPGTTSGATTGAPVPPENPSKTLEGVTTLAAPRTAEDTARPAAVATNLTARLTANTPKPTHQSSVVTTDKAPRAGPSSVPTMNVQPTTGPTSMAAINVPTPHEKVPHRALSTSMAAAVVPMPLVKAPQKEAKMNKEEGPGTATRKEIPVISIKPQPQVAPESTRPSSMVTGNEEMTSPPRDEEPNRAAKMSRLQTRPGNLKRRPRRYPLRKRKAPKRLSY
ncbi:mucin-2-like [Hyla sarda]|uniref:mucin-2-like n=1 Tax=Hyla sarda TaxID=327740 RepID=UPI0024C22E6D|nr:mucin-2-like [Hyla sarda]